MADNIEGSLVLISRHAVDGQTVWPVGVDELKAHAQISHDLDDELLLRLIADATEEVEARGQVALISQSQRLVLDRLPSEESIWLPRQPLISVDEIGYLDADDAEQMLDDSLYSERAKGRLPNVYFKLNAITVADGAGVCWIDMTCGYGESSASVPGQWRQIVLAIAAHRYERREMVAGGGIDEAFERVINRKVIAAGGMRRYV